MSSKRIFRSLPAVNLWGPAVPFFLITLIFTTTYFYKTPIFDHWDLMPLYQSLEDKTLSFESLFRLHGSHWHASGYAVLLILAKLTGMSHLAEVLVGLMFAGLAYIAWARIFSRQQSLASVATAWPWGLAIGALFFFSLDQAENWLMGWQISLFAHLAGVLWTIEFLTRKDVAVKNTLFAILMAAFAIFGFATGWALLPIGLALLLLNGALESKQGVLSLTLWGVFSALMLWLFFHISASTNNTYLQSVVPDGNIASSVPAFILYAIKYVASPVSRFSSEIAIPVFALGTAMAAISINLLHRGNKEWLKISLPSLALAAYAIGAGLLTSLGRLENFGSDSAFLSRYITFGNMYWIAILSLVFLATPQLSGRSRKAFIGFIALMCVFKLATTGNVVQRSVPNAIALREAALDMQFCYPNIKEETRNRVASPTQRFPQKAKIARKYELSVFKPNRSDQTYACHSPEN